MHLGVNVLLLPSGAYRSVDRVARGGLAIEAWLRVRIDGGTFS